MVLTATNALHPIDSLMQFEMNAMKVKYMLTALFLSVFATAFAACGNEANSIRQQYQDTTATTVRLLYMGQASIRIATENGKVIYVDPYAGDQYDLAADLILVTHEHFDHNAVAKVRNRKPDCRIIRAKDAIIDGIHQSFHIDNITIEAVEAGYNSHHDVRECVGYVLTFGNGRKVYISGDTSITEQMRSMSEMHIDYAFLCTDGVYNMGNEEAEQAAEMIKAHHTIPYHNSVSNDGEMFDREAAERFNVPGKMILLPGKTLLIE